MSGAVTTAGRVTRRTVCEAHSVEFGQTYTAKTQEHDSAWLPPCCPKCEVELRDKILADEELARQVAEVEAEADKRAAADPERAERIRAAVDADMAEEAAKMLAEFYATRREEYETWHENGDWQALAARIKEERRAQIFEQLKKERT